MAEHYIKPRDVSKIKDNPTMLMLRKYHNAIKERGGVRQFFIENVLDKETFSLTIYHRDRVLNMEEAIQYLEMYSHMARANKYHWSYVEFIGERTKPFISKTAAGPRELVITSLRNYFDYGVIVMWYDPVGTFLRYIFVPEIDEETHKMKSCSVLLDVELYNYQAILPPAVWDFDEIFKK